MAAVEREADIVSAIRRACGKDPRVVLWRNNTGMLPAATRTGTRPLAYGLCVGSADLIGLVACEARAFGRFLALEVKTPTGRPTDHQLRFIALVNSMGWYAAIVRSVDEARAAVDAAARGERA